MCVHVSVFTVFLKAYDSEITVVCFKPMTTDKTSEQVFEYRSATGANFFFGCWWRIKMNRQEQRFCVGLVIYPFNYLLSILHDYLFPNGCFNCACIYGSCSFVCLVYALVNSHVKHSSAS